MVIKDLKKNRYVLTKIEKQGLVYYFTMGEEADIDFYTRINVGAFEELGSFVNGYADNQALTEIACLNEEACYKIYFEDFVSKEEKEKYQKMKEDIKHLFLTVLKDKLKENLYKFYITNNRFELWKNNFEDKIYEIAESEYYIDDEEFEIFYEIDLEENYKFEFIKK